MLHERDPFRPCPLQNERVVSFFTTRVFVVNNVRGCCFHVIETIVMFSLFPLPFVCVSVFPIFVITSSKDFQQVFIKIHENVTVFNHLQRTYMTA